MTSQQFFARSCSANNCRSQSDQDMKRHFLTFQSGRSVILNPFWSVDAFFQKNPTDYFALPTFQECH